LNNSFKSLLYKGQGGYLFDEQEIENMAKEAKLKVMAYNTITDWPRGW